MVDNKQNVWSSLLIGIGVYYCFKYLRCVYSQRSLPPSPSARTVFGHIFAINSEAIHHTMAEWAVTYGDVMTLWFPFRFPVILFNSFESIKPILHYSNPAFNDRASQVFIDSDRFYIFSKGNELLQANYTKEFKEQKKATIQALKFYGEGMIAVEEISDCVILDYLDFIEKLDGQPFLFKDVTYSAVSNIVTSVILGKKFVFNDPEMLRFRDNFDIYLQSVNSYRWLMFDKFPILRRIFPFLSNTKIISNVVKELNDFMDKQILELKEKFENGDKNVTCFAEKMLTLTSSTSNGDVPLLDDYDYKILIYDLLVAGFSTTSSALNSLLLILLNKPDVEQKIVDEINLYIGTCHSGVTPKLEDRDNMPYTNATILELLRYISHVTFGIFHSTKDEVTINDGKYTLPAKTRVMCNLWYLHHNEELWDEPWSFKPERFIDPDTGELLPPGSAVRQRLMPFGAGARLCPGETMAKNRLFLFITNMLQQYKWLIAEGEDVPSCDPRTYRGNFIIQPNDYYVRVKERCFDYYPN